MAVRRKKLFVLMGLGLGMLIVLNYVASKLFLVDIVWLLRDKGPACGYVNGWLNGAKSVDCPTGYYCDYSHSIIDGPGRCLKK